MQAKYGGAVVCEVCNITMLGNNILEQNGLLGVITCISVCVFGGRLQFIPGITLFLRNEAEKGGPPFQNHDGATIVLERNKADYGGVGELFFIIQLYKQRSVD